MKFDAAPVVDRVVTHIFQACMHRCADDHRHVIHIESADKEQAVLSEAVRVCRDILQEDVAVDVCKQHIICVSLE